MVIEYKIIVATRKNQTEDAAEISLNQICSRLEDEGFDVAYKKTGEYE